MLLTPVLARASAVSTTQFKEEEEEEEESRHSGEGRGLY